MKVINERVFHELNENEIIAVEGGNATFFKILDLFIRSTVFVL